MHDVLLGNDCRGCRIGLDAETIAPQPGMIEAMANRRIASFGREIGLTLRRSTPR